MTTQRSDRLTFQEGASNKEYVMSLTEQGGLFKVTTKWGRIGAANPQGATKYAGHSLTVAEAEYEKILSEKIGKGYLRDTVKSTTSSTPPPTSRPRLDQTAWLPSDATEAELPELVSDDAWWMQEKEDGIHLLAHRRDGTVVGTNRLGQVRALPPEIAAPLMQLPDGVILDGEEVLVYRDGEVVSREYVVYDCLATPTEDLRSQGYGMRWEILCDLHAAHLTGTPVRLVMCVKTDEEKVELFERVHDAAGEGVIFKHVAGKYEGKRLARGGPIRRFKFFGKTGRRAEAIVYRRTTDQKNSLDLFLFDGAGKQHDAGTAMGMTGGHRWINDLEPGAARVAEIQYQSASPDRIMLGAQVVRWREDKPAQECLQSQLVLGKKYQETAS